MKTRFLLFSLCVILLNATNSDGQIGKRWYSYSEYVGNTGSSFNYGGLELWNDTTGVYGYMSLGTAAYFSNNFTSAGLSFAPVLPAWNSPTLYGSTIKVGPSDAYTIDSVAIFGTYLRNNLRTLPKDTLRLAFVYGNGAGTTNLPLYSLSGTSASYGVDPLYYLQMMHDSLHNIAGKNTGVLTPPYVQSIVLSSTDTAINFGQAYALTTPFAVPAGNAASMSLTFKSGDASYTPFDTIVYASGDYKYGDFIALVQYYGGLGSPVYATYDPADSNVGYFKEESVLDNYGGKYAPTWAWTVSGGGPSELQYPVIEYHINCPTCDLNDTIVGTMSVCPGSTSPLSFSLTGGSWSSSNTAIATVSSSGVVGGVSGGVVTITYNLSGHHAYASFTVNPTPLAITGTLSVCQGASTVLTDLTPGGGWGTGSPSVATLGGVTFSTITVHGAAPGTSVISYVIVSTGCSTSATVIVNPAPSPITGTTSLCGGATTTLHDASSPGAWSSSNTSIASVLSSGVVTGGITGSATITYTSGGCSTTTSVSVLAPPTSAGSITGGSVICAGANTLLSDLVAGGVWSSTNTAVATVDGSGTVYGVSGGSATISYTVTNICGSIATGASITINPLPNPGVITGAVTICQGDTTTFTDTVGSGTWSSSNTAIATVTGSGIIYGISAGASTITYSVTNTCGTTFVTQAVNVLSTAICHAGVKNTGSAPEDEVTIYPNPNKGTFTLNILSQDNETAQIVISNIVGEKVKEITALTNKVTEVNLGQAPGIYILSVTTASGKYVARVIVE